MQPYLIAIIAVAATLIAVILLLFAFAAVCHAIGFSGRCDKVPLLKYFEGKDFTLPERPVEIRKGKVLLRGAVYGNPSKTLVLFCHGLGAGHLAYTTEIAALCRAGAQVLAVDYEGCNLSEGKSIRGMYSGAECVLAAVGYVKRNPEFAGIKLYLFGHSWGGYSALCAAQRAEVDGVIAVGAPDCPVDILYFNAFPVIGKFFARLLKPFWRLIQFIKFGRYGNTRASRNLPENLPVLLVHGENDSIVPAEYSAFARAEGGKVKKLLCEGKSHNPYNSPAAQKLLIELSQTLARAKKMGEVERTEYFSNFDYAAATEEDESVMREIFTFIGL